MWKEVLLLMVLIVRVHGGIFSSRRVHKQKVTPIEDLVKQQGYPIEKLYVPTKDEYMLGVFRVRHGKNSEGTNKQPVLLWHGMVASAASYLGTPHSMVFHLADRGYDVWIGNSRGTSYAKGHVTNNFGTEKDYWDFSFHEMGVFDLPAVLKRIRHVTNAEKVHYIGYSMSTTMFLIMGSEKPRYLANIDKCILIAPIAMPHNMILLSDKKRYGAARAMVHFAHGIGVRELFGNSQTQSSFLYRVCSSKGKRARLCEKVFRGKPRGKEIYDFNSAKEAFRYRNGGTNVRIYKHYMQIAKSEKFRQFDYKELNYDHYGHNDPPEYSLEHFKNKIYLIVGGEDDTASIKDVPWLSARLPKAVVITGGFEYFRHRDFMFGGVNLEATLYKTIDNIFDNKI